MSPAAGDPVADALQRRFAAAAARAHAVVGAPGHAAAQDPLELVGALIGAVEHRLAELGAEEEGRAAARAHDQQLRRLTRRFEHRADALRAVDRGVAQLREITAPSVILERAPVALCETSGFARVVVSAIRHGHMVAEAAHFTDDPVAAAAALEQLKASPPRIEHPLLEADLVRRRRATIVTDVQVHPRVDAPAARVMGWHSFAVAPIVVGATAIGVVHADTGRSGRALDVLDGDVAWAFARGLADVYETAALRRALRGRREEMRAFVDWLGASSSALADAPLQLVPEWRALPMPPGGVEVPASGATREDRRFDALLTRRELEVLRGLARGEPNASIAAELVISEATVKFHVANLLRKLRVSNRAEAVSRYHRLLRVRPPPDG